MLVPTRELASQILEALRPLAVARKLRLAAIYGATMLYWLRDDSEGAEATLRFLDRRIEAIMLIPKVQRRLGELAARLPDPFGLLGRFRRA